MTSSSGTAAREPSGSKRIDPNVLLRIRHLDVTRNITDKSHKTVAHGGYSDVFRGRLRKSKKERVRVAIKRLRFNTGEKKVMKARPSLTVSDELLSLHDLSQQFAKEVYVWSKLSHPNILPLLGYAICEETRFPLLVSEWMHHGTAWSYV